MHWFQTDTSDPDHIERVHEFKHKFCSLKTKFGFDNSEDRSERIVLQYEQKTYYFTKDYYFPPTIHQTPITILYLILILPEERFTRTLIWIMDLDEKICYGSQI